MYTLGHVCLGAILNNGHGIMTQESILDRLLSAHTIPCSIEQIPVSEDDLVHVFGAQEPVRDQPDERARTLLRAGWLSVESVQTPLREQQRQSIVSAIQQSARTWLQNRPEETDAAITQQVRWLTEKTRPKESNQQIGQRVWLAVILYQLGCRGLAFEPEGHIRWDQGITGRIGLSPDAQLDLIWEHRSNTFYTASFRSPDGIIARGKGRNRWFIYRLTVAPAAEVLIERYLQVVHERVAVIVASETYATQPQLPRDFYGGDEFQQACIDAQDGQFDHILVLSPEHGAVSLDDIVPSDCSWSELLDNRLWAWQTLAMSRLGAILLGVHEIAQSLPSNFTTNWWGWLNPKSSYSFTVFGGGFPVRLFFDFLSRTYHRQPRVWPAFEVTEYRQGYTAGDFEDGFEPGADFIGIGEELSDAAAFEIAMQDINQLLEWSAEFVGLVNLPIPTSGTVWELAADEAVIPMRILDDAGVDIDNLLDMLTDITLLLEQPLPITALITPSVFVSALLQISHSLVHDERESIPQILGAFQEKALSQYVEKSLQERQLEDRLCACLSLAEQLQMIALTIPHYAVEQLLVWMQTFISVRLRQLMLRDDQR